MSISPWFEFQRALSFIFRWSSYTRDYTVVRRIIYLACTYTYRVLLPLLLRLCTRVVSAAAAAVRRRVPDGKHCCWFIECDSIQSFLSLHS